LVDLVTAECCFSATMSIEESIQSRFDCQFNNWPFLI
jgi:hypothetical protein